jgi:hypothetical protein
LNSPSPSNQTALNVVGKDNSKENVLEKNQKRKQSPVSFIGKTIRGLAVSSGEEARPLQNGSATRLTGPKMLSISSHSLDGHLQTKTSGNFKCGRNVHKFPP